MNPTFSGDQEWEIPRSNLNIEKVIGRGAFGVVSRGSAWISLEILGGLWLLLRAFEVMFSCTSWIAINCLSKALALHKASTYIKTEEAQAVFGRTPVF